MKRKKSITGLIVAGAGLLVFFLTGGALAATSGSFTFGVVLVGPYNDHGWSEAHYTAGKYVEGKIPGAKMIWLDKLNPADRKGTTLDQVVSDMIAKGAKLIFTTSDDFKDETRLAAKKYPEVTFIQVSGDDVWTGKAPKNLGNYMGRMEYTKMIAGCAAAMSTQTGKIGYLGPLINDETRRLVACGLPGGQIRLDQLSGEKGKRSKIRCQMDRVLVQHPGCNPRSDQGGQ